MNRFLLTLRLRSVQALLLLACLTACAPTPTHSPDAPVDSATPPNGLPPIYAPRPGDDALLRGEAFIDTADLLSMESYPVQFSVTLKGSLPSPCHGLRVVYHEPDENNKIILDAYSVADPKAVCTQMVQPFEQGIYLGSFRAGHYAVWVNGKQVAEFDA